MGRIEELAERYGQHIQTRWQRTVAGAQRVIMVVYDKELERALLARKQEFENKTRDARHDWFEVDLSDAFTDWMTRNEYREAYFESPQDLHLKLEAEFAEYVAERIRSVLRREGVTKDSVVAVFGVATLFGFTRVSKVLKLVEPDITGRLLVFFPGQYEQNNYRLLDARDGWNYMAVPITLHSSGGT
jgi:hypothetical protein